jgi:transposase-like protein
MDEQDENEVEASSADVQFGRFYLPCPVCRNAVSVAQAARNDPEPPRYQCPLCGTTFVALTD